MPLSNVWSWKSQRKEIRRYCIRIICLIYLISLRKWISHLRRKPCWGLIGREKTAVYHPETPPAWQPCSLSIPLQPGKQSWGQITRSLGEHTTQSTLHIEVIKASEIYLNRIRFVVQKVRGAALSLPECRPEKEIRERGKGAVAWGEEGPSERGWDAHALPLPVNT